MAQIRKAAERVRDARERLTLENDVWLATSSAQGPWMIPLWFVWHGGQIFLATSRASRTARNIAGQPAVRLALQSTESVVILDGNAVVERVIDTAADVLDSYAGKYGGADPRTWADAIIVVTPDRAQAWRSEDELTGRTIMRNGRWDAEPE